MLEIASRASSNSIKKNTANAPHITEGGDTMISARNPSVLRGTRGRAAVLDRSIGPDLSDDIVNKIGVLTDTMSGSGIHAHRAGLGHCGTNGRR